MMRHILFIFLSSFLVALSTPDVSAQCFVPRWNMTIEDYQLKRDLPGHIPLYVDFSDVYNGVGSFVIEISYNPEVLDFIGVDNPDISLKGVTAIQMEPGKLQINWVRSTFQGIMQTSLVGRAFDLTFHYHGGQSVIGFGEVVVTDIWRNYWIGETFNGSIREETSYILTLTTDPPGIGAVFSGGGKYYHNDNVFISVEDPLNYRFTHWKNKMSVTAIPVTPASRQSSFQMPAFNIEVTAYFEQIHADPVFLTLSFDGQGAVRVGNDTYNFDAGTQTFVFNRGDEVALTAIPADDWGFSQWTDDFRSVSHQASIMMDGDKNITARFSKLQPVLFLEIEGHGTVNVGGNAYTEGAHAISFNVPSQVNLSQSPAEGWMFGRWMGDMFENGISVQTAVSVQVILGVTFVTVVFEEIPVEPVVLQISSIGSGSFLVNGVFYEEALSLEPGTEVSVEARAEEGWEFDRWEGDGLSGGVPVINLTIEQDLELVARFVRVYTLSLSATSTVEDGLVQGGGEYREGTAITIMAEPLDNHYFAGWTGAQQDLALLEDHHAFETSLTMPARELLLTANYIRLYNVTFLVNMQYTDGLHHVLVFDSSSDQVVLAGDLFNWNHAAAGSAYLLLEPHATEPDVYKLTLQLPAGEYQYAYLLNDGEDQHEWTDQTQRSFVIEDQDMVIYDWFGSEEEPQRKYIVHAASGENGSVYPTGEIIVNQHETLTISIVPDEGYHIAEVVVDGVSVDIDDAFTLDNITAHHEIYVAFAINTYSLLYLPGDHGSLEGDVSQTVAHGSDGAAVFAVADEGYLFLGWSDGRTDNPRHDEMVIAGFTVTAVFSIMTYAVEIVSNEGGSLSLSGELTVNHGDDLFVEVTPQTGYHIEDVLLDGVSMGAVSTISLGQITGDHHIQVVFAINTYIISVTYTEHGTASQSGEILLQHGGSIVLTFHPNPGYHIEDVLVDGISAGQAGELVLEEVSQAHDIFVSFALTAFSLFFEVRDAASGAFISDAHIILNDEDYGEGAYSMLQMVPDTYYYTVTREGYFEVTDSVTIVNGDMTVSVEMTVDNTSVHAVVMHEMKVWPVPAREILWVAFDSQSARTNNIIELYNLQGRLIRQYPVHDSGHVEVRLDLHGVLPGIYLLSVRGDQHFPTQRIIIR